MLVYRCSGRRGEHEGADHIKYTNRFQCSRDELWLADESFKTDPLFERVKEAFTIRYPGGAVVNVLTLLSEPNGCYIKPPRQRPGGCAIWDVAAVSLMLRELGGTAMFFDGNPLALNRSEHVFFHDVGLVFLGSQFDRSRVDGLFDGQLGVHRA